MNAPDQGALPYAPDYKPSDVRLIPPNLLGDTMRKAEAEWAAGILVLVCQKRGDVWQPVNDDHVVDVLREELEKGSEIGRLVRSPVFNPDAGELVSRGFGRRLDDRTVELTEAGFEAIRKWVAR